LLQNQLFKDVFPWLLGISAVFAYVYPWVLAGESGYIRIHDSLDSHMAWIKILTESNFWFASNLSQVGPIAEHGMPRISYPRELSVITWIYAIFDPYWAYVVNQFVLRIVAFSGMYIFLKSIIQPDQNARSLIVFGVSLCYAFLPFWAWTGGVASLPFIFYALFRIWKGYIGKTEVIILILYPFYSSTVLIGMFIIGIVWLLALIKYLKYRQMSPLIVGALIITAAHLVVDYRLWSHLFFGGMISHRVDRVFNGYSFSDSWASAKQIFFKGDWAVTLHNLVIFKVTSVTLILLCINLIRIRINTRIISFIVKSKSWQQIPRLLLLIILISIIILSYSGYWNWPTVETFREAFPKLVFLKITSAALIFTSIYFIWIDFSTRISAQTTTLESWQHRLGSGFSITKSEPWPQGLILAMVLLFFSSIVISFYAAFWNWSTVVSFRQTFPILMEVNFTRLTFFLPFIWMVTFALALVIIVRLIRIPIMGVFLVTLVIGMQIKMELDNHEYTMEEKRTGITFQEFFSEDLFEKIEKSLPGDKKSYLVGSIGIHPSVLQYNGFRTADGYLSFYPKAYKLKFRKAVINEFSKNEALLSYFDDWGSRFYFFSAEMKCPRDGQYCSRHRHPPQVIKHFDLDIPATRALGVKYLFSVPTISNATELGLTSMGTFTTLGPTWDTGSPWVITVYRLPG
jgi:hypothetical protein